MLSCDTLIANACIVTVDGSDTVLPNGDIWISDGKIIAIGADLPAVNAKKMIDAKNCIVMPGMINCHTHIPMAYFRGMADDLCLDDWLHTRIWPAEAKHLDKEFVYHAALHGISELISSGTTCFFDMYFFGKETARAADIAGIRAIIGEGVLDFPAGPHKSADEMIKYAIEGHKAYQNHPLIEFALTPHAIYTCNKDNIQKAVRATCENQMLVQIHLAETEQEVHDSQQNFGRSPANYLHEIGALSTQPILAHSTWLDASDIKAIQNCSVCINTKSNMKLASGIAPLKLFLANNINVCLGTDSVASNNTLSLFEEMRFTALLHKVINQNATFLTAGQLIRMVTINAARAIGKEAILGSLEIDKQADICIISAESLETLPIYDPVSHLVYTMNTKDVRDVLVNGRLIYKDKQLVNIDSKALANSCKKYQRKILD